MYYPHRNLRKRRHMKPEHFAVHMRGGGFREVMEKPYKLLKGAMPMLLLGAELARIGTKLRGTENSQLGRVVHNPKFVQLESLARLGQRVGLV